MDETKSAGRQEIAEQAAAAKAKDKGKGKPETKNAAPGRDQAAQVGSTNPPGMEVTVPGRTHIGNQVKPLE